jgi:hypothetical protein
MKYRVRWNRWDTEERTETFTADSDAEAKAIFEKKWVNEPSYDWDYLHLERIDIVEKTTHIGGRIDKETGVKYHV